MNLYTFFKFPYKVKKEIIYTHTNIKYNFFFSYFHTYSRQYIKSNLFIHIYKCYSR